MEKYKMEIQDQMNFFALKISSQMLHCVLYFKEHLDEKLVEQAVLRTLKMEPILGCRLIIQDSQPYWEYRNDLEQMRYYEIMETKNVQNELQRFFVKTMDAKKDPLVQVKIFRDFEAGDCLCIKMNHAICDAGGLKDYSSLLAKLYTEGVSETDHQIRSADSVERGQNQFMESLPHHLIEQLREKSKVFMKSAIPNWSLQSKGYTTTHPMFLVERINSDLFCKIKQMAKQQQATINDVLLAGLCLVLKKEAEYPLDRPMIIQVPVDLRRYLLVKKALVCNLSGAEYLQLKINEKDDFMDILEKVQESMNHIKENFPGLTSAFSLNALSQMNFVQAQSIIQGSMDQAIQYNMSIPLLTNMGVIENAAKNYGDATAIDGYLVSPLMYSPGLMVGVSSFDDKMTLSVGFCEDSVDRETIRKLLSRICAEIENASCT